MSDVLRILTVVIAVRGRLVSIGLEAQNLLPL